MRRRLSLVLGMALVLSGCRAAAFREYHYTQPVEFYFSYPESGSFGGPPVLVIAVLGEGGSPLDCIDLFLPLAEDRGYALLCPRLGGADGLADAAAAERDLAGILTELYAIHTFRNRFFLAGFGDGAEFVLGYTLRYPYAVSGVSAMSATAYPEHLPAGLSAPVQLIVGSEDRRGREAAREIERAWRAAGMFVRLIEIEGDGRGPSLGFARLASELSDETSRGP